MDLILQDFKDDLKRIDTILDLLESTRAYSSVATPISIPGDSSLEHAVKVHNGAVACGTDIVYISGSLVLYVSGRFEFFVRTRFEEMCDRIAAKCTAYQDLPNEMKLNIQRWTIKILENSKRYDQLGAPAENFLLELAENLKDTTKITKPNFRCLSITETNMRPEALAELFGRIGFKDIWDRIGNQAIVQTYFGERDVRLTTQRARQSLEDLMDIRNRIAHPSSATTWPDVSTVKGNIQYLAVLGEVISLVVGVFESSPPKGTP